MAISEGTKSYLFGCHQFILHPLWVLFAWRLEYKKWPKWWEFICIFLHDIGVCGRQYLSSDQQKKGHWYKGAYYSFYLVWYLGGKRRSYLAHRALKLVAGHCPGESGYTKSRLYKVDKRSFLIAPMWWLWLNHKIEKFPLWNSGPRGWQKTIRDSLDDEEDKGIHELYLLNRS